MDNKSILRQLKKYNAHEQKPEDEIHVPVPRHILEMAEKTGQDPKDLIKKFKNEIAAVSAGQDIPMDIGSMTSLATQLGVHPNALDKVPIEDWCNVLYPYTLYCAYYLTMSGRAMFSEQACDDILQEFMQQRDLKAYAEKYKKAATPEVKRLVMLRILLATYRFGENKMDNVLASHKLTACEFLGVEINIPLKEARDMIEEESRKATIEQQILGRIGYLMTWNELSIEGKKMLEDGNRGMLDPGV